MMGRVHEGFQFEYYLINFSIVHAWYGSPRFVQLILSFLKEKICTIFKFVLNRVKGH